ncbi:DNA-3-methyladenine glycosylase 2 family protein [Acuticoccus sp. MNP-M23]|uniref:DNA-3-methyladenine glycosylase family protein n=1 Tax=Acuticoccus sp. MNP-M23 TaxID=3072793 RepID=UPI002815B386|nr:DNA-3-methyladenine glycosylase 2 family protein [Acuticoccus sp. MNP-M23]WMS41563.1 DNA-3-methyladenine glycosylase 2 family protein [Acuticoccus sp. MNP-M23]
MVKRIRTEADLARALDALLAQDARLLPAAEAVGRLPLRLHPAGLAGLLRIVAGQQLSTASAAALWTRFQAAFPSPGAGALLAADDDTLRAAGLSRQKMRTVRAIAGALDDGLDLEVLAVCDAEEARAALEAISGIGPWTADLYLMFCAGHPDILPVGDLAVRRGMTAALALPAEPPPDECASMGRAFAPYRSTAARLFWAYYAHCRSAARKTPKVASAATPERPLEGMPL